MKTTFAIALAAALCALPAVSRAHEDEWPRALQHERAPDRSNPAGTSAEAGTPHGHDAGSAIPAALRTAAAAAALALALGALGAWHRRRAKKG